MNTAQLTIELSKMSNADLVSAVQTLTRSGTSSSKSSNIGTLVSAIQSGIIDLPAVQSFAGKGTPVARAQTAAQAIDPQASAQASAAAAAAGRAESAALEALAKHGALADKVAGVAGQVTAVQTAVQTASETLARVQASIASVRDGTEHKADIERAIAKQVQDAFAPIRAAAEANGTQEQVVSAAAAPVGQATALQVFGVDARDLKGDPLMFDLWSDPAAPAIDPTFIWTDEIVKILAAGQIAGGLIWCGGEKGTGKTETARQFAARTGRAFTRINFRKFTTTEDYLGATGLVNGSTQWTAGPMLTSWCGTPGSVTLLDELSNADPGELAPLNGLLEQGGRVNMGGKVWSRAPGAFCFAADNTMGSGDASGQYSGTRAMNSALLDRFPLKVAFTYLPLDQEVKAVMGHTQCSEDVARRVMRVITTARAKVHTGEVVSAPSIRQVIAWIRTMPVLGVREAWVNAVASAQPPESAVAMEAIYQAEVDAVAITKLLTQ